jgi:hypothetical protein
LILEPVQEIAHVGRLGGFWHDGGRRFPGETMAKMSTAFHRLAALAAALLLAAPVQARCVRDMYGDTVCPPAGGRCATARWGDWACAGPGGDARLDRLGMPVCGVGRCVRDLQGDLMCSSEPWGSAALNRYKQAVCTGNCEPASLDLCHGPRQSVRDRTE